MNEKGYKEYYDEIYDENDEKFYMNVVGYKVSCSSVMPGGESFVLYERSGI